MSRRFGYLLETVSLLGLTLLIGLARGNAGFIDEPLHPFYFVILAIVLRYGYVGGLVSATSASALYLGLYVHRQGDFRLTDLWGGGYPILAFIAFGMVLGLLVEVDKNAIRRLRENTERLTETVHERSRQCEHLSRINARLSEQVATSEATYGTVFERTRTLFGDDAAATYRAAHDTLRVALDSGKAYVFHLEGQEFRLAYPREAAKEGASLLAKYADHIDAVRKSHRFLRLDMIPESEMEGDAPIFIGPILHEQTDTLYGMLVVGDTDLLHYNEGAFLTFRACCRWLGDIWHFRSIRAGTPATAPPKATAEFDYLLPSGASREEAAKWLRDALDG